jgi:hypothetical protein
VTPAATAEPAQPALPVVEVQGEVIKARISHYYPGWGGPNCSNFVGGRCVSNMASGKPWEPYLDQACACPAEFPFGTKFVVQGKTWVCMDRGGAIVREGGKIWLDLLTKKAIVPYGAVLKVEVIR